MRKNLFLRIVIFIFVCSCSICSYKYHSTTESSLLAENIDALCQLALYEEATAPSSWSRDFDSETTESGNIVHRCICYEGGYIFKSCESHGWELGSVYSCSHVVGLF